MMEQMTLNDLKTGMHVIYRDGSEYLVLKDTCFGDRDDDDYVKDVIVEIPKSGHCFTSLKNYNKDFTNSSGFKNIDIVAVYSCDNVVYALDSVKDKPEAFTQIFAEEKPITRAESEEILGVKIID